MRLCLDLDLFAGSDAGCDGGARKAAIDRERSAVVATCIRFGLGSRRQLPPHILFLPRFRVRALPGLLKADHAEFLKVERESERHRTEKETLANRELVKGHSLGRLL